MATWILVIEDDEAIAEVLHQVLSDEGYTVEHARSPQQARALLAAPDAASWDLIISDASLARNGNPLAWLNELRALTAVPIVIVSAWPQALLADYAERGFAAVLEKPFDLDDLLAVVRRQASAPAGAGESIGPEPDVLVMTTLPGETYRTYMDTALSLQSCTPVLVRHVLSGVAPLFAEARAEKEYQGQWPEDLYLHATLGRHNVLRHRGVHCALSPEALRVHARAADAVTRAIALLERAGETYALACTAVERGRARRVASLC
jgi:two-component system response regulator QseB